jgi:GTP cyclohydrolase IB
MSVVKDGASLPDIHARKPKARIKLDRAGVEEVRFPLTVPERDGGTQQVNASFRMFAGLDADVKGVNMSRFVEEIHENWQKGKKSLSGASFQELLTNMATRVDCPDVYVGAKFDYFVSRVTPASGKETLMSVPCKFVGLLKDDKYTFVVETRVPIATYCPCSKEMCLTDKEAGVGKGAHAQRGIVTTQVKSAPGKVIWLEDLIELTESCASAPVYTLLKRPDEKFVTEQGYDNPKFTEDVTRELLEKLQDFDDVLWARVRTRNYESIHPHNATSIGSLEREDNENGTKWKASDDGFL